jgi:nitrite reductase/ring-hydroxylating ferredoxin subunit
MVLKSISQDACPLAYFAWVTIFFAIDDTCTHANYSLSEGMIFDGQVECPLHAGTFDIRTGAATGLPCVIPVKTYPITVDNGRICADLGAAE